MLLSRFRTIPLADAQAWLFFLKITALFMASLSVRPAVIGEIESSLGLALALGALVLHLLELGFSKRPLQLPAQNGFLLIVIMLLWSYIALQGFFADSERYDFIFKAVILHMLFLLSAGLILMDAKSNQAFFKLWIYFLALNALSYAITLALGQVVGLTRLYLFSLNIPGYENSGNLYLPVTMVYRNSLFGENIPRLMGFLREPGILQALYVWAIVATLYIPLRWRWLIITLLVMGVFATFSTTGLALLGGTLGLVIIIGRPKYLSFEYLASLSWRVILLIFLFIVFALGVYYMPGFGLAYKLDKQYTSFSDRFEAVISSFESVAEKPWGLGLYGLREDNAGINLLAQMSMLGIIGFILVCAVYFLPFLFAEHKLSYLLATLPLFLTALLSQPLVDAPLIYLFLMLRSQKSTAKDSVDA
ncbi:MAG: hypothetical protein R2880_06970 [Deinococcales bacterium]